MWQIRLDAPLTDLEIFEQALAPFLESSTLFEIDEQAQTWQLEGLLGDTAQHAALEECIATAAHENGLNVPPLSLEDLPEKDWLSENRASFTPISVGRFYVHSSYDTLPPPDHMTAFEIDASLAFGTGAHHTTQGCLAALEQLAQTRSFSSILDLGTGSGILAMAAATLFQTQVLATDIDPTAVEVARNNVLINRCADQVHCVVSDGFEDPLLQERAPFDLIIANILAAPLILLSAPLAAHLAPGGAVILAGLLEEQAADVLHAYTRHGLILAQHETRGDWAILTLQQPTV